MWRRLVGDLDLAVVGGKRGRACLGMDGCARVRRGEGGGGREEVSTDVCVCICIHILRMHRCMHGVCMHVPAPPPRCIRLDRWGFFCMRRAGRRRRQCNETPCVDPLPPPGSPPGAAPRGAYRAPLCTDTASQQRSGAPVRSQLASRIRSTVRSIPSGRGLIANHSDSASSSPRLPIPTTTGEGRRTGQEVSAQLRRYGVRYGAHTTGHWRVHKGTWRELSAQLSSASSAAMDGLSGSVGLSGC